MRVAASHVRKVDYARFLRAAVRVKSLPSGLVTSGVKTRGREAFDWPDGRLHQIRATQSVRSGYCIIEEGWNVDVSIIGWLLLITSALSITTAERQTPNKGRIASAAISMSVLLDRYFEATLHERVVPAVCT